MVFDSGTIMSFTPDMAELFHKYESNENGRDFVCGDIHGCFTDLEDNMRRINFDTAKDRMFCVGDLTDRGPESSRAIHFIKEDWFIPVMGNHEDIILQCYRDKEAPVYWHNQNGGEWIHHQSSEWIEEYISLIEDLPLVIQVGRYGIVHSIVPRNISWGEIVRNPNHYRNIILWRRYRRFNEIIDGIDLIYSGHTIHREPVQFGSVLDIDTGAFLGHLSGGSGKLTVIEMDHSLSEN